MYLPLSSCVLNFNLPNENEQVIHVSVTAFFIICVFLTQSCNMDVQNYINPNSLNLKTPTFLPSALVEWLSELYLRKLTQPLDKRGNSR